MVITILMVAVFVWVAWYGYETRQKLIKVVNIYDEINAKIGEWFLEDRARLDEIEKVTNKHKH